MGKILNTPGDSSEQPELSNTRKRMIMKLEFFVCLFLFCLFFFLNEVGKSRNKEDDHFNSSPFFSSGVKLVNYIREEQFLFDTF